MEKTNSQNNNKMNSQKNTEKKQNYEYDNEMSLNEIAINTKLPDIKNIPQEKKESEKYFDRFYYSMWLSNKD